MTGICGKATSLDAFGKGGYAPEAESPHWLNHPMILCGKETFASPLHRAGLARECPCSQATKIQDGLSPNRRLAQQPGDLSSNDRLGRGCDPRHDRGAKGDAVGAPRAILSEVDTCSREENALKQESGAYSASLTFGSCFHET
jgi:hypothetical protein